MVKPNLYKIKKEQFLMKKIIIVFLILYGYNLFAQEKEIKKPEYVIIANNKIISKEKLEEYGKEGYVKSMNKGVSKSKQKELVEKFGNKIGDREFIVMIDLLTEKERIERIKRANTIKIKKEEKVDDGLKIHINDSAKNFTVQMINGEDITLSDLKGKVVLLNFWATWCAPCLMEFHEIPSKILKEFKNDDFVFIPISRGESEEKVRIKMLQLKEKGIHFNAGIDPNKKIWDEYATQSIPKNFLIDQNGIVKFISTGYSDESVDKIVIEIKKLLAK